jgi:hypothetical protein
VLVYQQNANILPSGKLLESLLDVGGFGLVVGDEEVLAGVWCGRNVADAREEHARHCILQNCTSAFFLIL